MDRDRQLGAIEWARAAAEIAFIVIGILAAFAIDRWWEGVQQRDVERDYLARLLRDFRANRQDLASSAAHEDSMKLAAQSALRLMRSGNLKAVDDSLGSLLSLAFDVGPAVTHMATYDELKTSGALHLIRDDSLRAALADFDAMVRVDMATASAVSMNEWLLRVRPYVEASLTPELYMDTPQMTRNGIPPAPMPVRARAVAQDRALWNILAHRVAITTTVGSVYGRGLRQANLIEGLLEKHR